MNASVEHVAHGVTGSVHGYSVVVLGDVFHVSIPPDDDHPRGKAITLTVSGLAEFIAQGGTKLGWADTGDFEILYLYKVEADGGRFGYGLNLWDPHFSEWGYVADAPEETSP